MPTVFVAVAGRSNGLGPVMSGNTAYPVINCPPITPDWGAQDVWSSLRMPSGKQSSAVSLVTVLRVECVCRSWVGFVGQGDKDASNLPKLEAGGLVYEGVKGQQFTYQEMRALSEKWPACLVLFVCMLTSLLLPL